MLRWLRSAVPEEAKIKPCHHGWCGAPFCSPEYGPDESGEELVERTAEPEEAKMKPCRHGWCRGPFCSPECGPHGSGEALAKRAADDTNNIEEADRDTAALPPPLTFCEGCDLFYETCMRMG